ncbi:MAG: pirin family protein [Phycisphaeraceae bacterium]|nr:MAG: pirin family protein [Phycisphaeraceae bacterium]
MMRIRRAHERGTFDHGWLKSAHTFSFGHYQDPEHMGFRALRVINDDIVGPGEGFGEHPHRDMEIITYPLSGAVRHRDSLGNEEDITHGMIQRMTAGRGIRHSEFNPSPDEPTHLLQMWILPDATGHQPEHESKTFPISEETGRLHLLASGDGRDGSLRIHQDADLHAGVLGAGDRVALPLRPGRHAWVHVARGSVVVNGEPLAPGDGAAITDEPSVVIATDDSGEVLVFDLA